mmetsp:Transcript_4625/g.3887  ORF Transcript_4625/g.3887 Transcript_4625/m.3887 type:complete len:224 (+) Transcript_4625:230-901(+)
MKIKEINKILDDGRNINFNELNETFQKAEDQANDILGNIYTALKRAKLSITNNILEGDELDNTPEVTSKPDEENKGFIEQEEKVSEDIAEFTKTVPENDKNSRRKHFATNKNLENIKIEDISVNHSYKVDDFKDMPVIHQVLILCSSRTFLSILSKLNKMKEDKSFDKYLFKSMEENINLIYKMNFEADFMKCITWNQNFNQIINDSNQYLLEVNKTDSNIFK